jgi:hypothetical protein
MTPNAIATDSTHSSGPPVPSLIPTNLSSEPIARQREAFADTE